MYAAGLTASVRDAPHWPRSRIETGAHTWRRITSTSERTRDRTTPILSSPYARIAIGESIQARMGISSTANLRLK